MREVKRLATARILSLLVHMTTMNKNELPGHVASLSQALGLLICSRKRNKITAKLLMLVLCLDKVFMLGFFTNRVCYADFFFSPPDNKNHRCYFIYEIFFKVAFKSQTC